MGEENHIAVHAMIGEITVPSPLEPIATQPGAFQPNLRIRNWDSFVSSAPVPEVVPSPDGLQLEVPWTRLPTGIVEHIARIDPQFAAAVYEWYFLGEGPASWSFARVKRLPVADGTYAKITGMRAIYGVNLFNFMKDLRGDYHNRLKGAVSAAAKLTVQDAGRTTDQALGFPAIAGAAFVQEKQLVLSYADSFDSILAGVSDAQGATPSDVTLVVWYALRGRPIELKAALDGLEWAVYRRVGSVRQTIAKAATVATACSFVLGALLGFYRRRRDQGARVVALTAIGLAISSSQYALVGLTASYLPFTSIPALDVGVIASVAAAVGYQVDRVTANRRSRFFDASSSSG